MNNKDLVMKIISGQAAKKILQKKYKRIKVCWDIILDLEKIAIGAYSPLTGFMKKNDLESVIYKMRLTSGHPWTIPIFLPVHEDIAKQLSKNEKVFICEENTRIVGLLKAEEVFSFNKQSWAKKVFGTNSKNHPGVRRLFDSHNKLVGGEIWMIAKPDFELEKFNLTPLQTRAIIKKRGWKTVCGFQTRNAPHRAHEYLQKLALTVIDGILIHPIIGWKKDGDFKPQIVIKAYDALIKKYFPKDSVIFAGLATAMRYAGPREAVFHAIIRKNYGCTHFIVGRDHAGVGGFYDIYDAHRIFDHFPELDIEPILLRGPYYCKKCADVVSDKICPHSKDMHRSISGTLIRKLISQNKKIPLYLMRPEVAAAILNGEKQANEERCFL